MTCEPTAATALFPNLKTGTPDVVGKRQQGSVADAMYAHLKPPPPQAPRPTPTRPTLTREQAFDWSDVDPSWARLVGLVAKEGRR